MRDGGARVGERKPRGQRRRGHAAAQIQVLQVFREPRHDRQDLARRHHRVVHRDRIDVHVPQALERVRQRVEAGADRELARLSGHQRGIDQRVPRIEAGRDSEYFLPDWVSHTVAQEVTSLPVPAVVGTAMIGVADSASAPVPVCR